MKNARGLILDKNGNEYIRRSSDSQTMPNVDPNFFISKQNEQTINAILHNPYRYHVWVYACVRSIAQNVAQVKHNLKNTGSDTTVAKHDVLRILSRPNSLMSSKAFIRHVVALLMLPTSGKKNGGQCFIVPWDRKKDKKVNLQKGEIPSELIPLSEEFFKPITEKKKSGFLDCRGWSFEIPGAIDSKINFGHNEIIRVSLPDPSNVLDGMSPFSAISQSIEMDARADVYNMNVFENDGRLDGMLSTDQILEQEEIDQLKSQWYSQYTGEKRRRIAFLFGGMKFDQYALSQKDMEYLDQSKWNRQKILGAYGLNRIAIGDYEDINYATIREGRKILWYDTYIPIDEIYVDALNSQWISFIDNEKYLLVSDYSSIMALQSDMKERAQIGGILCMQMGFPASIASRIAGISLQESDLKKFPELDRITPKTGAVTTNAIDVEHPVKKSIVNVRDEYSSNYIKQVLEPVENHFKKHLDKYFVKQRNTILDTIDKLMAKEGKSISKEQLGVRAWEFLPDEMKETNALVALHKTATKLQSELEKKQIEKEFEHVIEWDVSGAKIDYWVTARTAYLRSINTKTFKVAGDAIAEALKTGTDEGFTVSEMTKLIKDSVHDVYEVRLGKPVVAHGGFDLGGMSSSKTIARTEMGAIATLTRTDIFKEEGVEKIEWITAADEKVREEHAELDGVQATYGDYFGASGLRWPRDQGGSAAQIINCRCSFIAVVNESKKQ